MIQASEQQGSDFALEPPNGGAPTPAPSGLLTRRELANALGVHMQTVTKWEREDMPIALAGGPGRPTYYSELEVRGWLAHRAAKAAEPTTGRMNSMDARAQRDLWQARLAEQQHKLRAGELLQVDDVQRVWMAELTAMRAMVLNSYATAADRVFRAAKVDGVAGVEATLKAIAYDVLRELSSDRPMPDIEGEAPADEDHDGVSRVTRGPAPAPAPVAATPSVIQHDAFHAMAAMRATQEPQP